MTVRVIVGITTAGSGSDGNPKDRDPDLIQADLLDDKISATQALDAYDRPD